MSAAQPGIAQASLTLGLPGDRFEQEADAVADWVLRGPAGPGDPALAPAAAVGSGSLQRAADAPVEQASAAADQAPETPNAETDEDAAAGGPEAVAALLLETDDLAASLGAGAPNGMPGTPAPTPLETPDTAAIQASALPGETPEVPAPQEARIASLRGSGEPLPATSRAFFESRFGHDFSHVRVHSGPEAGRLARSIRARAFTVGHDVVFGTGYYQPASPAGQWLLAHELTHVLQQGQGQPAGAVQVQSTGRPQLQGGFWDRLWGGIKAGAGAVWSGIKAGAGAVWSGIKWTAGKVWSGIKAVGRWGWNVLKSGAALAWREAVKFPGRVWRLIAHLGSGVAAVASWLWEGFKLAWHLDFKGMLSWLWDGIKSGAAWVLRLAAKVVDLVGVPEIWDLVFQIIKFNTRPLTEVETKEAKKTFHDSISYWQVRVDEHSLLSMIGAWFKGASGMGVTTFHTVNFTRSIKATPGSADMRWLTHELTHVLQYERAGTQYLGEAAHAQATAGYDYKGKTRPLWRPATNVSPNPTGKHFREYNREQQADIAADYYFSLYSLPVPSGLFAPIKTDYEPVVNEMRAGDV